MDGPRVREGARVLLLDEAGRLLLIRVEDATIVNPAHPHGPSFWITVGGGLEPGETFEEAALREVREETGMTAVVLGPELWAREVEVLVAGEPVLARERYFAVRVDRVEVTFEHLTAEEQTVFREHRWWTPAEVHDGRGEVLVPAELPALLERAIAVLAR